MSIKGRNAEELENILAAGDEWLRQSGVVTSTTHNEIVVNIRVQFPVVKHLEYYIDPNGNNLNLTVYVDLIDLIAPERSKMFDNLVKSARFLVPKRTKRTKKKNKQSKLQDLLDVAIDMNLPILTDNKDKLIDAIYEMLSGYLVEYSIIIRVSRYKKGMKNESK